MPCLACSADHALSLWQGSIAATILFPSLRSLRPGAAGALSRCAAGDTWTKVLMPGALASKLLLTNLVTLCRLASGARGLGRCAGGHTGVGSGGSCSQSPPAAHSLPRRFPLPLLRSDTLYLACLPSQAMATSYSNGSKDLVVMHKLIASSNSVLNMSPGGKADNENILLRSTTAVDASSHPPTACFLQVEQRYIATHAIFLYADHTGMPMQETLLQRSSCWSLP